MHSICIHIVHTHNHTHTPIHLCIHPYAYTHMFMNTLYIYFNFYGSSIGHGFIHSEPSTPQDFSFAPTPASMSLDQFWGLISLFTLKKRAMANQYFGGNASTFAFPTTTSGPYIGAHIEAKTLA